MSLATTLSLVRERTKRAARNPHFDSLEELFTSAELWGLTTASNLQRAICRVSDGLPLGELADDPDVVKAFGRVDTLPNKPPKLLSVLSGIRVAKTLFAACVSYAGTQRCDVSGLGPGEVPRIPIVSLQRDLAEVAFSHIVGRIMASPKLRATVLEEPSSDSILIRHPSGRPIEMCVVAGARAGSTLVARWLAGLVFDEWPRMLGGSEAVVNYDDMLNAALERMLPNTQILNIGSPYAPYGPAFDAVTHLFGAPTAEHVLVKAPAWVMNPVYWTPERVEEARRRNPDVFQTDVAAEFATPEEALFPSQEIDRATRIEPLEAEFDPLCKYVAAIDPATRGNGWTLIIGTRSGNKAIVAVAKEWRGSRSNPLSPRLVLEDVARYCYRYGVSFVDTDQHMADALVNLAKDCGVTLNRMMLGMADKSQRYLALRTMLEESALELPPEAQLRADMQRIKKRTTQSGIQIVLPQTADGRHCDYGPSLMLAMGGYLTDMKKAEPEAGSEEYERKLGERMKAERLKGKPKSDPGRTFWRRAS